jgi:hypothetical protein
VPQQRAALREFLLPYAVGQEAVVPQPVEATWRDVEHQPPQAFDGVQGQRAQAMAALVILGAEGHLAVLHGHETMVGNGHTVGRAGQVLEDVLRGLDGLFGVDHPLLVVQGGEEPLPRSRLGERLTAPRPGQVALPRELRQAREIQPPEPPREDPDGQEEVGATRHPPRAISRAPPGRQDTMEMGVMGALLAPGVEHRETAELRPEMLRVPGDVLEGLGDRAKEQAIEGAGGCSARGPRACGRVKSTWA